MRYCSKWQNEKTSDRCHVSMFCLVYSISRHGLLKDITNFVLNGRLRKTAVNPPNFWVLVKISHLLLSNFIVQTFSLHFSKQWAVLWIWKTISIIITMIWYVLTWIKSWHFLKEHKNWKIISSFDCVTKMSGLNGFRLDPA